MDKALVNIVITTTAKRKILFEQCLNSIGDNTKVPYRIIVVMDGNAGTRGNIPDYNVPNYMYMVQPKQGVAAALNAGWFHAEMLNTFHGDTKYFCYTQDDTIVTEKGWLETLIEKYEDDHYEEYDVGFFSGHDAPEHEAIQEIEMDVASIKQFTIKFKKFIRATNIIAETDFWRTIMPIPRHNPAGDLRGFPTPDPKGGRGKGSNIDVFLTGGNSAGFVSQDASPNCSFTQGKVCMVIPGLVKHVATNAKDSTWGNPNKEYHA